MAINIKIGSPEEKEKEEEGQAKIKLNARKTIDGNIMILDHNDIDIVIIPSKKKIIAFPKSSLNDSIYACQDRLFNYLSSKGVVSRDTVHSGDVYSSMQANYPDAVNGANATQIVLFTINKFMEEEKPHIDQEEYLEKEFEQSLTNPDEVESTELGEVPHSARKGTIDPARIRRYLSGYGPY